MRKPKSKPHTTRVLLPRRTNSLSAIPGTKLLARGKTWTWPHWPCVVTAVHNTPTPRLSVSFYPDHTVAVLDPADCLDLTHNEINRVIDYAKSKPRLAKEIPALLDAVFSARLLSSESLQKLANIPGTTASRTNQPDEDNQPSFQQFISANTESQQTSLCSLKRVRLDTVEQNYESGKARKIALDNGAKDQSNSGMDVESSFISQPIPFVELTKHSQIYLPFRKRLHLRRTS